MKEEIQNSIDTAYSQTDRCLSPSTMRCVVFLVKAFCLTLLEMARILKDKE